MKQTFIVTLEADDDIKAREVEEALNHGNGIFSLDFNHDEIIVAEARKVKENDVRELTRKDIRRIVELADALLENQEPDNIGRFPSMESYYQEILDRFNGKKTKQL